MTAAAFARAVLLLTAASALAACGEKNQYAAPPPPKVTVTTPIERDVTDYFETTGNTAAVNQVDLVARVQGFIQGISYTDGDYVKKGTLLFTIEPEPYRLKLAAAQAAESGAQATLKQADAELKRQSDLAQRKVATQSTLDQAQATRDSAQANLQQAQSNTKQAKINLDYTQVLAPFDGIVTARQVSLGQLVGANSPTVLATIVQMDPIWVNFTASERDVQQERAKLRAEGKTRADLIGLPVEVGLQTETGYPHQGKLDYVAPSINPATGTLSARASFPNADRALLPGFFVRVRIPSRPQPALLVPDAALGADQAGRYLLVVDEHDVVQQRKVEAGQRVDDLRVIASGLSKDDRVVVGGIMRAVPGQKVSAEVRAAAAN